MKLEVHVVQGHTALKAQQYHSHVQLACTVKHQCSTNRLVSVKQDFCVSQDLSRQHPTHFVLLVTTVPLVHLYLCLVREALTLLTMATQRVKTVYFVHQDITAASPGLHKKRDFAVKGTTAVKDQRSLQWPGLDASLDTFVLKDQASQLCVLPGHFKMKNSPVNVKFVLLAPIAILMKV